MDKATSMNTKVLKTFLLIFCSIIDICLLLIHVNFKHLIILILYTYNCVNLMSTSFILMPILMSISCCQFNVQKKNIRKRIVRKVGCIDS